MGPDPPGSIVRALLGAGVLTGEDVVARGVEVSNRSGGSSLHVVRVAGGDGLLVKQATDAAGLERLETEIRFYRLARDAPQLAAHLPGCRLADSARGLLVLDFVEDAETLYEHAGRTRADWALRALGEALGACHRAGDATALAGLRTESPWVLRAFDGTASPGMATDARSVLTGLPHRASLISALRRAEAGWRADAVVHGDLKFDNCLLAAGAGSPSIVLVDWELAALGDPAWDLGSVVQECLLLASSVGGPADPAALARSASAIGGFLAAYAQTSERRLDDELCQRVALCAGARLLQAALEYASRDGWGAPVVAGLGDLATRVLTDPDDLAAALAEGRAKAPPASTRAPR